MFRRLLKRESAAPTRQEAPPGPPSQAEVTPRLEGEDDQAYLRRLAALHLDDDVARRWLALLRPAVRLLECAPGRDTVARLGGQPVVPMGFEWPVWEGHGPLSFIGEVDLDALTRAGLRLDIKLPTTGRLLLFYFDGSYDHFEVSETATHRRLGWFPPGEDPVRLRG